MDRLQKAAVLTELIDQFRAQGSWSGHTHIQDATYFLQDVLGVPTGYKYILYKLNPYSFDLEEDLTGLRANYLIEFNYQTPGYGPGLVPTKTSAELRSRYPKTLAKYAPQIEFVARRFGTKTFGDMEKLTTALWVTRKLGDTAGAPERAKLLHELKPQFSLAEALAAVQEFDRITAEAKALTRDTPKE